MLFPLADLSVYSLYASSQSLFNEIPLSRWFRCWINEYSMNEWVREFPFHTQTHSSRMHTPFFSIQFKAFRCFALTLAGQIMPFHMHKLLIYEEIVGFSLLLAREFRQYYTIYLPHRMVCDQVKGGARWGQTFALQCERFLLQRQWLSHTKFH